MLESCECRKPDNQYELSTENAEQRYPELIQNAVELIHRNYAELYGVEELADELAVSKCHLVRAFSTAVGESPGKYLTAVRIDKAKNLLLSKEYAVEVVATLSGFSGANYFCKVFKKETKMSPLEYRKIMFTAEIDCKMTEMEKRLFV